MDSLKKIVSFIKNNNNFIILGHVDPDGDCIGSMMALNLVFKKLDKEGFVVFNEPPPDNLQFLASEYILLNNFNPEKRLKNSEWNIIALDSGDYERLGDASVLAEDRFIINIDHHPDNPGFGDLNYVNPDNAAVGQIIYNMIELLDIKIKSRLGTAIAAAIIADTGSMRYENTTPEVLRIIASLMETGVNIYRINQAMYGNYLYESIKLKGLALSSLKKDDGGKIAWLYIDQNMMRKANVAEPPDGLVNYARDIKGVEVGILFTEEEEENISVSFRSNNYIAVNEIADKFGGGGHPRAAGCLIEQPLKKVMEMVLFEVRKNVYKTGSN